jgi:hypothetical protein
LAKYNPIGIPRIWLVANAIWMNPMTRPRWLMANKSVMMASDIEPMTPPNTPVTILEAKSIS